MSNRAVELSGVPDTELTWCHETVQDVSRTFALTIDVLEEPMSSSVCVGYLLCRIADTIEDTRALSNTEKSLLLERYDRVLDPTHEYDVNDFEESLEPALPAERSDDWEVVADSGRVVRTFEQFPSDTRDAIIPPTRELISGMQAFVDKYDDHGGIRIQSVEELEEYCYYVAGTVGHLLTNLVVREVSEKAIKNRLRSTAEEFGLLLQLVNIAKDVHADYSLENSVYLPADWLDEVGASQDHLLSPGQESSVTSVIKRTTERARLYIDDARTYLDTLSDIDTNAFAAWTIPFLLAVGTLRELSNRPEDALTPGGVKISREEVSGVVEALTANPDEQSLATLEEEIRRGELV